MTFARVNFNTYEAGSEYFARLNNESNKNLQIFMALLSSYFQSSIDGPNYIREMKAMSIALAQIRLALDDIRIDTYYQSTRTDYLYQVLTSVLFPNTSVGAPNPNLSDLDFRSFLN